MGSNHRSLLKMTTQLQKTIAANLKRIRTERQLTQIQLCELISELGEPMYQSGYSRIESGESLPQLDTICRCAAALGVEPADILAQPVLQQT